MLRLLQIIFVGHVHQWDEPFNKGKISHDGNNIGNYYDCRCVKCGKLKVFNLK